MFDKPLGGTELMYNEFVRRISPELLLHFSVFNYANSVDPSKKLIYWNQLSYDQNAVQFLQEGQNVDRIDHFVFVSNWQAEQFRKIYKIPGEKTSVIKNACIGVKTKEKIDQNKKIKICYTSTPWRGLDVLLKSWELLNPENCELHIFSSCKIYGKEFSSEDKKYEFLYDWCKRLPNVVYRGSIPNEELRQELHEFDILAYPNTFEETSCIAVIEALSAGLRVITSSLGALPETCEGWARMYSYIDNREKHAEVFSKILKEEIESFKSGKLSEQLIKQSKEYGQRWHWDNRIKDWESLLNNLKPSNPLSKITKWITPNSILDIGANIGQFYQSIRPYFPNAKYHLIEGNENCKNSLSLLGVDFSIELLSDTEKTTTFWTRPQDPLCTENSIYKEKTEYYVDSYGVLKQTTTLDKLFNDRQFDLIKIDTQGSELDIIKGGENLMKSCKALLIEVSYQEYNINSPNSIEVIEYLESIGFKVAEIIQPIYHPITGIHIQDDILFIKK
jgi:FkbM family methyltransferase